MKTNQTTNRNNPDRWLADATPDELLALMGKAKDRDVEICNAVLEELMLRMRKFNAEHK